MPLASTKYAVYSSTSTSPNESLRAAPSTNCIPEMDGPTPRHGVSRDWGPRPPWQIDKPSNMTRPTEVSGSE